MKCFTLGNYPITSKRVLLRVDYNVPLQGKKVTNASRIKATLPTLHHLLAQHCQVIIATHLGKPDGKFVDDLRLIPVAKELQTLLPNHNIIALKDCLGPDVRSKIKQGKKNDIFLLENLRFYKEEEENDPAFAHSLASLADVYVNDAFAVAHRKHASLDAITHFLPSLAGFLLEKEVAYLTKALHPQRPLVWIMGGAKLDKVDLIVQALKNADHILIGGALAFSFLKAKGIMVGMSKTSAESVMIARKLLQQHAAKKIILPLDFVVAQTLSPTAKSMIVPYNELQSSHIGLDLGPRTIELFKRYLHPARTIVWNGPLGYFEWAKFALATKEIGRYLGELQATSIVGGGETAQAFEKFYLVHKVTHLSTGGGATLELLSGKKLPALTALEKNYQKFS